MWGKLQIFNEKGGITKSDVIIAKICLFAVKFTAFLIIAFAALLMIIRMSDENKDENKSS